MLYWVLKYKLCILKAENIIYILDLESPRHPVQRYQGETWRELGGKC